MCAGAIELVEAVDILHHAPLVLLREVPRAGHLHGCEDEEVLEVLVVRELGIGAQNNLLEQLNELIGEVGSHESLDSARHGLGVLAPGERRGDDLVHERALVRIVVVKHLGPELEVLALDQKLSLRLVQRVLVGDGDGLVVALPAGRRAVNDKRKVRVALGAVGAHHLSEENSQKSVSECIYHVNAVYQVLLRISMR